MSHGPLTVSDALVDNFFEIFGVFLVQAKVFGSRITLRGRTAEKKTAAPKMAIFRPYSGGRKRPK